MAAEANLPFLLDGPSSIPAVPERREGALRWAFKGCIAIPFPVEQPFFTL